MNNVDQRAHARKHAFRQARTSNQKYSLLFFNLHVHLVKQRMKDQADYRGSPTNKLVLIICLRDAAIPQISRYDELPNE